MSGQNQVLINADIHTSGSVLEDHVVIMQGGRIADVLPRAEWDGHGEVVDLAGCNVAAGFVDLQVNGGGGVLLNTDWSEEAVVAVLLAHQRLGATSIFPTVFTSSWPSMLGLLDSVTALRAKGVRGLAGIHFEGPVIEGSKAGVHDRKNIRALDDELVAFFLRSARELPTLVTLAPEHVSDLQVALLRAGGVLVLAGHTNASYERTKAALAAGMQGGTHLFNAMSAFGSREPGVVGALLADPTAYVSVIADGHHVHWASLEVAWRAKGDDRFFCVTDAMPCVGSDTLAFTIGELQVYVDQGRCQTSDGTLAGSALDMPTAVRNLVQKVGIPLPTALRMASAVPARFAGIPDAGELRRGAPADLVVFDNQLSLSTVYLNGEPLK